MSTTFSKQVNKDVTSIAGVRWVPSLKLRGYPKYLCSVPLTRRLTNVGYTTSHRSGITRSPRRVHTRKRKTGGAADRVGGSKCVLTLMHINAYTCLHTLIYYTYYYTSMISFVNKFDRPASICINLCLFPLTDFSLGISLDW